jgi:hypothetical protein
LLEQIQRTFISIILKQKLSKRLKREIMKRLITIALFFGLSAVTLSAQQFRLGVQASPTFSWMSANQPTIDGGGLAAGLQLGLLGDYYIGTSERYAISMGLSFLTGQGGTLTYSTGGNLFPDSELSNVRLDSISNGTAVRFRMQYVEIPLSVKLKGGSGNLGYYVQIPMFSLAIPVKGRANIGDFEDENVLKSVVPFALTWGLGAGAEYKLSDVTLFAGLSFQNHILDIIEDKGVLNNGQKQDAKEGLNRLTLQVGVFF